MTAEQPMTEPNELGASSTASNVEMQPYSRMVQQIERRTLILGALFAVVAIWPWGWAFSFGVLFGTALAWYNFRSLAGAVNSLGDRITNAQSNERGGLIVFRFVTRIFLLALAAYGIFVCSVRGLEGMLVGLSTPVASMICQAAVELLASHRRDS